MRFCGLAAAEPTKSYLVLMTKHVRFGLPLQPIDATHSGVRSNPSTLGQATRLTDINAGPRALVAGWGMTDDAKQAHGSVRPV